MDIIHIRNRYRYSSTWETFGSVIFELRFWYPTGSKPVDATYTLEKKRYSDEIVPYFDLSKFAKDYILKEPYKPTSLDTSIDAGFPMVNVEVITIRDNTTVNTEEFICVYGYEDNANATGTYLLRPSNIPIRVEESGTFSAILEPNSYTLIYYNKVGSGLGSVNFTVPTTDVYNMSLHWPGVLAAQVFLTAGGSVLQQVEIDNPLRCNKTGRLTFRNSFGGLEYMDIYGEVVKTVNTERNKFEYKENTRGRAVDNRENHYTYTINTGWIPEKYNPLVESLFISPLVYIDNDRIIINESTVELKTNRKDGLFQYTFSGTNSVNFAEY